MQSYVVLASRNGQPIDPSVVSRLHVDDLPELFFVPEEHLHWSNAAGSLHFFGWQAFTEIHGVQSHWHANESGLTAFSGHLWPRDTGWRWGEGSWASQLARFYEQHDPADSVEDLYGVFTAVRLPAEGAGIAVTDMLSGAILYLADTPEFSVVSSRAALAARAISPADRPLERDVEGSCWMPFMSTTTDTTTGFAGVSLNPFRTDVRIDPGRGVTIVPRRFEYWRSEQLERVPATIEAISPLVEAELRAAMRVLGAMPSESHQLRLSGGRDSRLVLGLVLLEGLQDTFEFFTYGLEHSPDLIAARNIATTLDLRWQGDIRNTPPPADQFEQQMRIHAFQTTGLAPGWAPKGAIRVSPGITATGNYSELMRFGPMSSAGLSSTSFEETEQIILSRVSRASPPYILPEPRSHYRAQVRRWIGELREAGVEPSRLSSLYLPMLVARWTYSAHTEVNARQWTFPLYTPLAAAAPHQLPISIRSTQRFHFDIIHHASEALAKLPLIDEPWLPATYAHLPDAAEYAAIEPLRHDGPETTQYRVAHFQEHRPVFLEYLSDRGNAVFEVLDFDHIQRILRMPSITYGMRKYLDNALVTAIWLGGRELPARLNRAGVIDLAPTALPAIVRSLSLDTAAADPSSGFVTSGSSSSGDSSQRSSTVATTIEPPGRVAVVDDVFPAARAAHTADLFLHLLTRHIDAVLVGAHSGREEWQFYPDIDQTPALKSLVVLGHDLGSGARAAKPDLAFAGSCRLAAKLLGQQLPSGLKLVVRVTEEDLQDAVSDPARLKPVWEVANGFVTSMPGDWNVCVDLGFPASTPHQVIPLGVDSEFFTPGSDRHEVRGDPGAPLRMLSVGSLEWDRGHIHALGVLRVLTDFNIQAELTITGDGPMRESLEFETAALGLGAMVTFTGWQPRSVVRQFMHRSDVYLQTNLRPSTALSTREAQAAGLPVVAFITNRPSASLRDQDTALLVPPRDGDQFAEKLAMLAADPELRRQLGEAGRMFVTGTATLEREANALAAMLGEVLDRSLQAQRLYGLLRRTRPPKQPSITTYVRLEEAFTSQAVERT